MSHIPAMVDCESHNLSSAHRDWLTRLPNQHQLWRNLQRELRGARQSAVMFALLFIDVDRFKTVNDSLGHLAGDKVLRAIARHLTAGVRKDDHVYRYGGDEFVVLMKDVPTIGNVRETAQRLGGGLTVHGTAADGTSWRTHITMSVGVAVLGGHRTSPAKAVDRADRAMYRAKALGRNGQYAIDQRQDSAEETTDSQAPEFAL
jgi:diguanylate cyclase (GGDEF)-like protein